VAPLTADRELRAYYLVFAAVWFAADAYAQALPLYFREVGVPLTVLGVARSGANVAGVLAEAPAGLLADRVDRATLAALACTGLAALLAVLPAARTSVLLGGTVVTIALARQFVTASVTPAISEALDAERAGLGWGLRDVGIYGGSALGLAVAGAVTARSGTVSVAFVPGAAAVLIVGGLLWVRVAEHAVPRSVRPVGWLRAVRAALGEVSPVADFRAVSNWRVLGVFCVVEAFVTAAAGLSVFLLPVYAADLGFGSAAVLGLFAASNLFGAPLSLAGGALADRYSRKWLYVGNYAAETVMLAVFAAAGTGIGAAVGRRRLVLVGLALFVVQTAFEPAVVAYFFDQFDDDEAGRAWSVEGVVARATGVVAPAVGGALYTADPRLVFLAATVLMGAGTAVALTLPE
jgi:MFS family permease